MEYPCFGRQQRPKLRVLFLLAVCVWLVYQIKHCINKKIDKYGGETKLVEEEFLFDGTMEDKVEFGYTSKDSSQENSKKGNVKSRINEHHKEQGNNKYPKTPSVNDSQSHCKEPEIQIREPPHEYEVGITERIQGVHSFQDENGVPPDDNETESMGGQKSVKEIV